MTKKEYIYKGVKYASEEEVWFAKWVEEMTEAGHILISDYQPKTFILTGKVSLCFIKQLKTKEKFASKHLMSSLTYTPDWLITFSNDFFYSGQVADIYRNDNRCTGPIITSGGDWWVDVKGGFAGHQDQKFPVIQKVMLENCNTYVQKVVISKKAGSFFDLTFCPKGFDLTPVKKEKRKLGFVPRTIEEWLNG